MASSEPVSGVRILGVMLPGEGTKVAAVGPVGVGVRPRRGAGGCGPDCRREGQGHSLLYGHTVDGTVTLGLEPRALGMLGQCLALSHVPSRTSA